MTEGAASGRRRHRDDTGTLPDWARWPEDATDLSIGVEEEVMLLNPGNWSPAQRIDTFDRTAEQIIMVPRVAGG